MPWQRRLPHERRVLRRVLWLKAPQHAYMLESLSQRHGDGARLTRSVQKERYARRVVGKVWLRQVQFDIACIFPLSAAVCVRRELIDRKARSTRPWLLPWATNPAGGAGTLDLHLSITVALASIRGAARVLRKPLTPEPWNDSCAIVAPRFASPDTGASACGAEAARFVVSLPVKPRLLPARGHSVRNLRRALFFCLVRFRQCMASPFASLRTLHAPFSVRMPGLDGRTRPARRIARSGSTWC